MINSNPYLNQPCERCGCKRYIAEEWKETSINSSGIKVVIEHTQINCSNKICQKALEEKLLAEEEKRMVLKHKKEADFLIRKENLAKARQIKKYK